jgi:hypothetical protein
VLTQKTIGTGIAPGSTNRACPPGRRRWRPEPDVGGRPATLRPIYTAPTVEAAETELFAFAGLPVWRA